MKNNLQVLSSKSLFYFAFLMVIAMPLKAIPWLAPEAGSGIMSKKQTEMSNFLFQENSMFSMESTMAMFMAPDNTVIFEESFEGATLATVWTFVNTHSSADGNWHLYASDGNAGNDAIEVLYWYYNMMDESAISPQIDLSAYSGQEIALTFDFF